jgi:hypothetical protein
LKSTLQRLFGQTPNALTTNTLEGVDVTTQATTEGAGLAAEMADQVAALTATVTSLTEQLADNVTAIAARDSKIAELTALVEAATEFKAAQEKAAAEAKVVARVTKLTEMVGTEQAASLQAATAALDDTAFDAVVSALSVKQKVEAANPAFKEVGAEGTTDQAKLTAEVIGGKTGDYLQAIIKNKDFN